MRNKRLMAVFALTALGLFSCNNNLQPSNTATNNVPVLTQKVQMSADSSLLLVSGNIEGKKTVRLGFMVAGKIDLISLEEGQSVKANQLLASLEPESYLIANEMSEANLAQTQDEYSRLSQMHATKSISESDFSKITNALKVAKAQQRLQAKNLADTKLYSPISGVLLKKGAEVGEIVGTGMPLFVVSDISTVKVNASVPESELHNLKFENEAHVYISSLDSTFTGKIVEIGSVAEATTRSFSVKVELKNPRFLIRPGMTAEVQINTGKTDSYIGIPADAVLHDIDNSSYVFVADLSKNQAFKRNVSLGKIINNQIEVVSGLNADEIIVVSGQQKLSNGASITIK